MSRGGSVEASGAARGGGEVVGGAGSWGWGGVVEGLVGTAGAARRGKSVGVSSNPGDDRRLFSMFPGLVVSARFARIGLATADNAIWRAHSANLSPDSIPEIPAEATTASGTATTVPASPDALTSPAEVSARCRLCSCDCGLLASSKPLTLAVGEAGGRLRLSRTTRAVVGTCGCCDCVTLLKRADRGVLGGMALSTRVEQPSYTQITFERNKLGQR